MSRGIGVGGLMRWLDDSVWQGPFEELLEQHLGQAARSAGVAVEELPDVIGEGPYRALWGFVFEDLITRQLPDGRVLAREYRKRRGWKESAAVRPYLDALTTVVPSLYEVSDIVPGESMALRDLVRGGEPVRVVEHTATRTVKPWDRIATRIVRVRGQTVISGAVLAFDEPTSDALLAALQRIAQTVPEEARALMDEIADKTGKRLDPGELEDALDIDAVLEASPFMMSAFWLRDYLEKVSNPSPPKAVSREGEPIEPVTVRWRLAKGARVRRLQSLINELPALRPASATFWNWLDEAADEPGRTRPEGVVLWTRMEDGTLVLGTVELQGRTLVLEAMTPGRAARGQALLETALGDLIEAPEVEQQTLDISDVQDRGPHQPPPGLTAEEERAIIHQELTAHYQRCLDEVIPALGDASPRQLAKTAEGRVRVVGWLKYLENGMAAHRDGPMAGYDLGWLWAELGLADRRR